MKLRNSSMGNALLIALLILGANPAYLAAAESFPIAALESQGFSSQSLGKLLSVVRGFAENGEIVVGELWVIKNRHTVLHEAVGLADRESQGPLEPGTICIRSMIVVLEGDRLALEIPWQGLVELKKAGEDNVWSFFVAPDNSVKFHHSLHEDPFTIK